MTYRVLHALDHSLPETSGYAVRSHGLLRALRGRDVDAIAVARSSRVSQLTRTAIEGVPYVWVPAAESGGPAAVTSALHRIFGLARRLSAELRQHRGALVHAHSPSLNGIAALWAGGRAGVPVVYEMRGLWEATAVDRHLGRSGDLRYRSARALESWLIRRAARLVVISSGLHGEALRRGVRAERIVRVPNGVDSELFSPQPPDPCLVREHALAGRTVFGYLGYFFAYEGVDILLRAFARVRSADANARLVLVGGGDEEQRLRALAAELGVDAEVIFAGGVGREEVRRWYSVCDVLVYPRRRSLLTEIVTPLKPLEAMAMERTVVASDVGGLREIVRDGETGVLVRPDDPEALATALAELAASPQQRGALAAAARRFACAERDWTQLVGTYEDLYRELIAPAGAG